MRKVKAFDWKTVLLLVFILLSAIYFGATMGLANYFSTIMYTAHDLLINTVFFILGITVLSGAFGSFLAEFGILSLLNKILAPIIKFVWKLPGCAALGALSTYLSDNPAIIALSKDKEFIGYFEEYQKPALTNFGTSFGMGLVVTTFMMSMGYFKEAFIGNIGAIIGCVFSTRLMMFFTKKSLYPNGEIPASQNNSKDAFKIRTIRDGSVPERVLSCLLEGGKSGLDIGFDIIPGVLIICTMVLMMTFGPGDGGVYTGAAYEGVPLLPKLGSILSWPLKILFGFESPDAIAFPVTALGAVGAAMALVPKFISEGIIGSNEIAVFTAIGMCWSGFLSTHVAMMDSLGFRKLTGKAILSHTIGGIIAGTCAHYIFYIIG